MQGETEWSGDPRDGAEQAGKCEVRIQRSIARVVSKRAWRCHVERQYGDGGRMPLVET